MIIRVCLNLQMAMMCVYLFIFSMALLSNKKRDLQGPVCIKKSQVVKVREKEKQSPFENSVSKEAVLVSASHCILSILQKQHSWRHKALKLCIHLYSTVLSEIHSGFSQDIGLISSVPWLMCISEVHLFSNSFPVIVSFYICYRSLHTICSCSNPSWICCRKMELLCMLILHYCQQQIHHKQIW